MSAQTLDDFRSADVFDSRDVIARIDDLEHTVTTYDPDPDTGVCDSCGDALIAHITDEIDTAILWCGSNDDEDREELRILREFADEASGYASDWRYGEAFIAESYFEEYAEQLADDIGAINGKEGWPLMHIDWKAAADDLKQDYTSVELQGQEFWTR